MKFLPDIFIDQFITICIILLMFGKILTLAFALPTDWVVFLSICLVPSLIKNFGDNDIPYLIKETT